MRFDCDARRLRRQARKEEWHLWFAWLPVRLDGSDCRWLEFVERKGTLNSGWEADTWWTFQYRAATAHSDKGEG